MNKIQSGEVRMRPRWQFVAVTVLTAVGLAAVAMITVFLVNLVIFKLRVASAERPLYGVHSAASYYGAHFPWLALGIGILSGGLLVWLVRRYDFSYRLGRWLLAALIGVSLIVGTTLAFTNVNSNLETFGPLQGIYGPNARRQLQQNQIQRQNHSKTDGSPQQRNDRGTSNPYQLQKKMK